jgi:hypothetical protein
MRASVAASMPPRGLHGWHERGLCLAPEASGFGARKFIYPSYACSLPINGTRRGSLRLTVLAKKSDRDGNLPRPRVIQNRAENF